MVIPFRRSALLPVLVALTVAACASAPKPASPPTPPKVAPRLTSADPTTAKLESIRPALDRCFMRDGKPRNVKGFDVTFTVAGDGTVTRVDAPPDASDPDVVACTKRTLLSARFDPNAGGSREVHWTFPDDGP